jgi:hypothetical protein
MSSFPSTEKPQYKKGCTVNVAFASLGFCIMTGMTLYYRMENRRRDKVEGGRPVPGTQLETVEKFDLAPGKCDVRRVGLELTRQVSDTSRDCC